MHMIGMFRMTCLEACNDEAHQWSRQHGFKVCHFRLGSGHVKDLVTLRVRPLYSV